MKTRYRLSTCGTATNKYTYKILRIRRELAKHKAIEEGQEVVGERKENKYTLGIRIINSICCHTFPKSSSKIKKKDWNFKQHIKHD